jgi:hypothetical protein
MRLFLEKGKAFSMGYCDWGRGFAAGLAIGRGRSVKPS